MKRRLGIRAKLALTYVIIAVPLVAVTAAAFSFGYQQAHQRLIRERLEVARLTATTFELFMRHLNSNMHSSAQMIVRARDRDAAVREQLDELLRHSGVTIACFTDSNGRVVQATRSSMLGKDLAEERGFGEVIAGRRARATGAVEMVDGRRGFFTFEQVQGSDERNLGVLAAFMDVAALSGALPLAESNATIVDSRGTLVYQSTLPDIGGRRNWARQPAIAAALKGRVAVSERFTGISGTPHTLVMVPMHSMGWAAGSSVSAQRSLAPLQRVYRDSVAAAALVLLIALTAGALTTRSLVRSISALAESSSSLGEGDLEEPVRSTSRDEVGDVAASLEETRRRLRDHVSSLTAVAEIGRRLTSSLDVVDIERHIEDGARRLFGATSICVLTEEGDEGFKPLLVCGDEARHFAEDQGTLERRSFRARLERGEPFVVDTVVGTADGNPVRGKVAVSTLRVADRRLGVLALTAPEVDRWRPDGRELKLLAVFSSLVANALNNASLFSQTRGARDDARRLAEQARRRADELDAVVRSIGDPVFVVDSDGTIRNANSAAKAILGFDPVGQHRQKVTELLTPYGGDRPPLETLGAEPGSEAHGRVRLMAASGDRVVEISAVRLPAVDGRAGVVATWHDLTDIEQARSLGESLGEIGRALRGVLDVEGITSAVLCSSAAALDAPVAVLLLREGHGWRVLDAIGLDRHETRMLERIAEEQPARLGLLAGQAPMVLEQPGEQAVREDDSLPMAHILAEPVLVKNEPEGVLVWGRLKGTAGFSRAHVEFAAKLAASTALTIEATRLYAAERRVSRTLQEGVLRLPERLPGVRFGHIYRSASEAARVGGDFYDLFEIEPGKVGVLIGDVSGKGLPAASLTSFVKDATRAYAYEGAGPAEAIARVNEAAFRLSESTAFVTLFFGILTIESGELAYCNAGHPPAIVRRKNGATHNLGTASPMVAAFDRLDFVGEHERLAPGDILVLYTDGVIEAMCENGKRFGEERLLRFVHDTDVGPEALPEAIYRHVEDCTAHGTTDDIAILALQPSGSDAEEPPTDD